MINNPISENPIYEKTPYSSQQYQQGMNMIRRMKAAGSSRVIYNREGQVIKIINR